MDAKNTCDSRRKGRDLASEEVECIQVTLN